jgi:hypothetical protein
MSGIPLVPLAGTLPTGADRPAVEDTQGAGLVPTAARLTAASVAGPWAQAAIRRRHGWRGPVAIRPGTALRTVGPPLLGPAGLAATILAQPRSGTLGSSVGTGLMVVAQILAAAWGGARLGEWRDRPVAARLHHRSLAAMAATPLAVTTHLHPTVPTP